MEPLACVLYSPFPTNESYNNRIQCCCSYVAKSFGIFQRVIKSQRVYTSKRSLSKKTCNIFHSCEITNVTHSWQRDTNPLFWRHPWVLPIFLKGFSLLNRFFVDKSGHATITFDEIMATPINRAAWKKSTKSRKKARYEKLFR